MFNCSDFPWQLYVGKDFSVTYNVKTDLESCFSKKFDFIRVPLVHPRYSKHPTIKRIQPMTRSDACLTSHQWNNCIQGKCSENINPDHLDPEVRLKWEESMINEIRWGVHLGVNSIVLNCPRSKSSNFARILNQYLEKGFYYQKILIHVGVSDWENWNSLRLKCGPSTVLGVSLDINTELSVPETERWLGEPIHTIYFSRSVFITNKDNYPVLSKNLQIFVQRLFKIKANVVVGPCRDHEQIRGYICYLFKNQPPVRFI
jgi:type II protein arginine methyltransferase